MLKFRLLSLSYLTGEVFYATCPTSVANSPLFQSSCEGFVSSKTCFSLSPHPFLFRSSTAFEKGAQPFTGGFMVDPHKNHYHVEFTGWHAVVRVTYTSAVLSGNISGFMFLNLSRSIYWNNLVTLSYVWIMASDKQIHHTVDHFPFISLQVVNSRCGNHIKKLFASSYPTVVLEVSTVFRIHSICGNDVVMFGKCGLF